MKIVCIGWWAQANYAHDELWISVTIWWKSYSDKATWMNVARISTRLTLGKVFTSIKMVVSIIMIIIIIIISIIIERIRCI